MQYIPEKLSQIGTPITEKNIASFFKAFLNENNAILKVEFTNLKLVSQMKRKDTWFVKYGIRGQYPFPRA